MLNGLVNDRQVSTSLPSEIETIEALTNKRGRYEEDHPSIYPSIQSVVVDDKDVLFVFPTLQNRLYFAEERPTD